MEASSLPGDGACHGYAAFSAAPAQSAGYGARALAGLAPALLSCTRPLGAAVADGEVDGEARRIRGPPLRGQQARGQGQRRAALGCRAPPRRPRALDRASGAAGASRRGRSSAGTRKDATGKVAHAAGARPVASSTPPITLRRQDQTRPSTRACLAGARSRRSALSSLRGAAAAAGWRAGPAAVTAASRPGSLLQVLGAPSCAGGRARRAAPGALASEGASRGQVSSSASKRTAPACTGSRPTLARPGRRPAWAPGRAAGATSCRNWAACRIVSAAAAERRRRRGASSSLRLRGVVWGSTEDPPACQSSRRAAASP